MSAKLHSLFDDLIQLVKELRDTHKGDPWILAQDFESLSNLTIEEAYEFAASVLKTEYDAMADELGDLILHIFLYAEIAKEQQVFDLSSIIKRTLDKQKRRKLTFKNPSEMSSEAALAVWESKKKAEKPSQYLLEDILNTLPALIRAKKIQSRVAQVGFDWPNPNPIYEKINEEIAEFKAAALETDPEHLQEELGDILFSVVNLARHYKIDPELALQKANLKFSKRFTALEKRINSDFDKYDLEALDKLWDEIKHDAK